MKRLPYFLLFLLYFFSLFTVVATVELTGYQDFLWKMTQENGFFESLTVLILFTICLYGIGVLYRSKSSLPKPVFWLVILITLLTFLAGMEEISWGQQLFHFSSSDYFIENNLQQETNLHNFVDANLFSSLIYVTIYTFFVFIPLLYKCCFKGVSRLRYFDLEMHHILIVLFSSSFQLYFYDDLGVYADMVTQWIGLILFLYVLWREKGDLWLKLHYVTVVGATLILMFYHDIFEFKNMQYEIREMFVTLAFLFIYVRFIRRESPNGKKSV